MDHMNNFTKSCKIPLFLQNLSYNVGCYINTMVVEPFAEFNICGSTFLMEHMGLKLFNHENWQFSTTCVLHGGYLRVKCFVIFLFKITFCHNIMAQPN